jgi:PAS domain S-box-containing protein
MTGGPSRDERMWAVFHASPVPTAITRLSDGKILLANAACLDMLGWEEEEFVGRTMLDVGFWARPDQREAVIARLGNNEAVRDLEQEIRTKEGESRLVQLSMSVFDLGGESCLVGQIHDVTEHRRLEARLRESEEHFRQITEALKQGFVLSSVETTEVLYASPAVAVIFGLDLQTIYDEVGALRALVHPDDVGNLITGRDTLSVVTDLEFRVVRPGGETRWLRSRVEPVRPEHGRPTRLATIIEDITEERALHEALRESEERFRRLAESSKDVITRSSPDAVLHYVSPASRAVYGFEPDELIGRSGWEFIHPDDLTALRADVAARGSQPDDLVNEYRVRRKDGSYAWMEAKTHTLRDPASGAVTEFHTSSREVSERKQAEADIRRARDEAEQANNAKSEFLSRMSHELRTPLHAILGFGELLDDEELSPSQRESLEQITKGGRHLLGLIDEVLDITRIERGELRLSLEPVHLGEVVQETMDLVMQLAASRSVTVPAPAPEDLDLYVLADRQRLKQVLLNLLWNGVKYNRDGGEVTVRTVRGSPVARIEVVDTGIGIAPEDLERAFTAFERLGAEATGEEGTGLGLAVSKRLIEAMGGEIGVESEPGRGTTFWLALPAVAPPESRITPPAADAPAVRVPGLARTVLYVEDNPSNIKLVERILAKRPEITLLVATEGGLGLELAREHRPALVLLDLNLPGMAGEHVLRQIRDDARTADLPVVVVSADAIPGQFERLRAAGADGYLTKPFEMDQFLAVIDEWSAHRAPRAARRS